jgi:hypothetical protein
VGDELLSAVQGNRGSVVDGAKRFKMVLRWFLALGCLWSATLIAASQSHAAHSAK